MIKPESHELSFEEKVIAEVSALRLCVQFALGKIAILDGDGNKELERLRGLIIETHQKEGINVNGSRNATVEAHAEASINRLFDGLRTRVPPKKPG